MMVKWRRNDGENCGRMIVKMGGITMKLMAKTSGGIIVKMEVK